MAAQEPPAESGPEVIAQRSADRVALALEEVGFDVGIAFPTLGGVDRNGAPVVDLGQVAESVATRLASLLSESAHARCAGS